jgi:hypothetical protein
MLASHTLESGDGAEAKYNTGAALSVATLSTYAWQQTQQAICCQILHFSLGPALMWASLTLMRKLAVEFQN